MLTYSQNLSLKDQSNIPTHLSHRLIHRLIDQLCIELQEKLKGHYFLSYPKIYQRSSEGYRIEFLQGKINFEAENPLSAAYGLARLKAYSYANELVCCKGWTQPVFGLRPIWLSGHRWPENEIEMENLCRFLIENGYNAVIVDIDILQNRDFSFYADLQACGLKLILNLIWPYHQFCPCDPLVQQELAAMIQGLQSISFDGLFWESQVNHPHFYSHSLAEDATLAELMLEEARLLERSLKPSQCLIYYLSSEDKASAQAQAHRFSFLAHRLGQKTFLAFSVVNGNPSQDYLSFNAIWEVLRHSATSFVTPLLPIFNVGQMSRGEGLWPTLAFENMDRLINQCKKHPFQGVIALTKRLPAKEGLFSCQFWVLGQMLWQPQSASILGSTWFKAFRPNLSFSVFEEWLKKIQNLSIELSFLRDMILGRRQEIFSLEDCSVKADSLLAQLDELQRQIQKETLPLIKTHPTFGDYFTFFYRDARRIILQFLQQYHLPLSHILKGHDLQPAFWSAAETSSEQGLRSGIKLHFFEEPNKGEKGSIMEQIYLETTLFL